MNLINRPNVFCNTVEDFISIHLQMFMVNQRILTVVKITSTTFQSAPSTVRRPLQVNTFSIPDLIHTEKIYLNIQISLL